MKVYKDEALSLYDVTKEIQVIVFIKKKHCNFGLDNLFLYVKLFNQDKGNMPYYIMYYTYYQKNTDPRREFYVQVHVPSKGSGDRLTVSGGSWDAHGGGCLG